MLSNSSVRSANMVPISCSTSPAVRLGFRVGVYSKLFWREESADDVDIFWREMSAVVTGVEGDISGLKVTAAAGGGEEGVVVITWVALDGIGLWLVVFVLGCW